MLSEDLDFINESEVLEKKGLKIYLKNNIQTSTENHYFYHTKSHFQENYTDI